ncbi:MAG: hypothetical protein ACT4PM_11070 [Gemmatimonadales bacterium]
MKLAGCQVLGLFLLTGARQAAHAQAPPTESLVRRYAGSYDKDALLRERAVRTELIRLLGTERAHLERNLFVSGSIDLLGGWLVVTGNAAHGGGEEEAVVCMAEPPLTVHVALLSGGRIQVFTRAAGYDGLPICIKDWITQANSGHRDRFSRPPNVEVKAVRP